MAVVQVEHLSKHYAVGERAGGLGAAFRSLIRRQVRVVRAVDDISFDIDAGEVVGFLGPNGAGKTTTLKMLSGLLFPTAGEARVLGHVPWHRHHDYLRQMTLVMGQRNQLYWDLPAMDTLLVNQAIYQLSPAEFRHTLAELTELLDLGPLLGKQVRQLSLGERMKCELAAALLHRPQVLFLDEPTIGLDVTMQGRIRVFIRDYNRRTGATVLLTSHYMADVTALCRRVIVIHQGQLLYDGNLSALAARLAPFKVLTVVLEEGAVAPATWSSYGEAIDAADGTVGGHAGEGEDRAESAEPTEAAGPERAARVAVTDTAVAAPRASALSLQAAGADVVAGRVQLRVPKDRAAEVTARLLAEYRVADLTVEDPPVEAVIDQIFRSGLTG